MIRAVYVARPTLLALLAPFVLAGGLDAQERAATVTLEEAIALARERNPDVRQARNGIDRAAAAERRGWGAFLPEVRSNLSMTDFSSRTLTARNEFGEPVTLDDPRSVSAVSASGGISASLTVFDGFRQVNELQAARAGMRAADAFRDQESVRVEAEVERRFYAALAATRLLEVEERLLAAAEERLAATRAMVRAGRATPQDVLGGEVDVARAQMALDAARTGAHTAGLALREVIGLEEDVTVEAIGDFPEAVELADVDVDTLVAVALRSSPRVRRARAAAERAGHMADAARGTRWPTIRLSVGVDRGVSLPNVDQLRNFPWNRGFGVGVSASLPLFTGFAASERITQASVAHADAEENVRRARLAVQRAVRGMFAETRNAYRAVRLAERAAELSRRRMETGQEGFRRGVIGFTELQQLIDRSALAERTAVRARLDYARAIVTLEQAVGRTLRPER